MATVTRPKSRRAPKSRLKLAKPPRAEVSSVDRPQEQRWYRIVAIAPDGTEDMHCPAKPLLEAVHYCASYNGHYRTGGKYVVMREIDVESIQLAGETVRLEIIGEGRTRELVGYYPPAKAAELANWFNCEGSLVAETIDGRHVSKHSKGGAA